MKKIIFGLFVLCVVIAGYAYYTIDAEKIASHWNNSGEVNGYMTKFWGIFLFPFVMVGIYLFYLLIPKIDPLKKNIKKFKKYYDLFVLIIIAFLAYVFILSILFNLGFMFNMTMMMMPALALLFMFIGYFMKKLKRNWFVGIRTPWTISNDKVWSKTHKLGSILYVLNGVFILVGMFFSQYLVWFVLIPVLISTVFLVAYSYLEYNKLK